MRLRYAMPGVAFVALALLGCSSTSPSNPEVGNTDASSSAVTTKQDEGEGQPIDVLAELAKQGFTPAAIAPIERNAAYWLMPFRSPLEMSQKPNGKTSCTFYMGNKRYPGKGALAAYPIKSGSIVKLRVRLLNPDGSTKEDLRTKVAEVKFRDLKPEMLASLGGLDLSGCTDQALR